MQKTETILRAMRRMGERHIPLTRVYRSLYSEDLLLTAYDKIARNKGALTAGTANDTVDGMSIERIRNIREQLRLERFKFRPVRRVQIPKKSGGSRPLGIPDFSEKLVQEAMRMILEAYYEPRFSDNSHGFRPGRGCHTALKHIKEKFVGTVWLIEGDIKGCFNNIDHEVLMETISRDIKDQRLLNLIRKCLKAGYMEDWRYHKTYSGTPQGGIISPLLANIYLNELDTFIEKKLIPKYTRGSRRAANPEYERLTRQIGRARAKGDKQLVKELTLKRRQIPSINPTDPNFRRLKYCRYADDFILGFIGPKREAEEVKAAIGQFLREKLHLEMSESKTLITHARTEQARFLGYSIGVGQRDDKVTRRKDGIKMRSVNGRIILRIPNGRVDEFTKPFLKMGKPTHQSVLINCSDAEIILSFQLRYRGKAEYYKYAVNRGSLQKLKYVMETALTKTLAAKHKTTVPKIYRKYSGRLTIDGRTYKTIQVKVSTKKGEKYIYWGAVPLKVVKMDRLEPINDERTTLWTYRTDLVQRLMADKCEICGAEGDCEVHHIRKLSDLKKRWRGRKKKPEWVVQMIARQRKTLVLCKKCHREIHAGNSQK
ncbi:MAG: hypothetical protein J7M16_08730 [Anaerolineae bacterium]|nr:hypothetical protein [Anaerolineae bacterium]